ncbi:hypothetical protein GEMRC1_000234 [Eukaryota sp. GEM-RC1]
MVSLKKRGKLKLQQELNLLINLNHPSILRVFGISYFQDDVGIVMEKASSSLPSPNSLTSSTLRYAKELCQAVKFLHLKSVVHGVLKPANILLVNDLVRVADFGTSKNLSATTLITRSNAMTPKYAAPEQFDSDPSHASDIYSLGIVLYEVLTGQEAFEEYPIIQIYGAKMSGKPLPFDKPTPTCLKELIKKCMNPDPLLRPKINEIIDILNNVEVLEAVRGDLNQSLLIANNDISSKARNENLIGENLKLEHELSKIHEQNESLKDEILKCTHQIQNSSILKDKFHQKEHCLNKTIDELRTELLSVKKANSDMETSNSDLSLEIQTLKAKLSQVVDDNSRLDEENESLKQNLKFVQENQSISKLKRKIDNFRTVCISLKDENSCVKGENSDLSMKVSTLISENATLKEQHLQIVQDLRREHEGLRTNLQRDNSELTTRVFALSSEIQKLKAEHSQVVNENSRLKTLNSKIVCDNTRKIVKLKQTTRDIQSIPQSKIIKFSQTIKHSELHVSWDRKRVDVEGLDWVNGNISGEDPLLPGHHYTWKMRYQGGTDSLYVGVIDGSKFKVQGSCWENAHCFANGTSINGCLSGNRSPWIPGELLEINVNLVTYTLTIKSMSNSSINLTGTLPRLSSYNYYPYAFLYYGDHVLEIVE